MQIASPVSHTKYACRHWRKPWIFFWIIFYLSAKCGFYVASSLASNQNINYFWCPCLYVNIFIFNISFTMIFLSVFVLYSFLLRDYCGGHSYGLICIFIALMPTQVFQIHMLEQIGFGFKRKKKCLSRKLTMTHVNFLKTNT
jgi:hypothetical protein